MSKFLPYKKALLKKVYEKAEHESLERSLSGILKDLENNLRDDFNIPLSYKTLETYYKFIVEKNEDYNIKSKILNDLSTYLGFKDFHDFCKKTPIEERKSSVEVNILETEESRDSLSEKFSKIIINITNQPIFTLPEFVTKHSSSFGIMGILLLAGFIFNKTDLLKTNKNAVKELISDSLVLDTPKKVLDEPVNSNENVQRIMYIPTNSPQNSLGKSSEKILVKVREKECMYWDNDHYEPVFCNEKSYGTRFEALDESKILLKKIKTPDTLTVENAIGKVWYDKSDKKVEFFTHYGIHPKNGKTLKPVTVYILEKYAFAEK